MSRLVGVDNPFVRQRRCEFGIRRGDRRARFLPRVVGTAQTDRNVQRAFENALDDQPRHPAHHRQIRNQRRQLGPAVVDVLLGQRREGDRAAVGTLATMATVLGDVRGHRRQLRDLVPARVTDGMPRVQTARTAAARLRCEIDRRIHALDRHQCAMMARMPRLPRQACVDSSRADRVFAAAPRGHRRTAASM